jgi:hypothetical protein
MSGGWPYLFEDGIIDDVQVLAVNVVFVGLVIDGWYGRLAL